MVFPNFCVEYTSTNGEGSRIRADVCEKCFTFVYGVSERMNRRFKADIRDSGGEAIHPSVLKRIIHSISEESPETKMLSDSEYHAVAFIREFCERLGESMPHTAQEVIRISFPRKHVYEAYCNILEDANASAAINSQRRAGRPLSDSIFYRLWNDHCAHIELARWKGDFAICDECKRFAQKEASPHLSESEKKQNRVDFKRHLKTVQTCRMGYYDRQMKAIVHPNTYLSMIIDGCDLILRYCLILRRARAKRRKNLRRTC